MADWYTPTANPATRSSLSSALIRTEFASIQTAMALLPTYTANANLFVAVNSAGTALEATNAVVSTATTANALGITASSLTTGSILALISDSSDVGTRSLLSVVNDNTAATGATPFLVQQDAAQRGIHIDQNGNGIALDVDTEATTTHGMRIDAVVMTTGNVIDIPNANALTTGSIADFVSNSASPSTRDLVFIRNQNTSATGTVCLDLLQSANSTALYINQDGNGRAILIDTESVGNSAIDIQAAPTTTGNIISCADADGLTTGSILNLVSNSASASTRSLAFIHNDHTSATGATGITVRQDAAQRGIHIDQNGNGKALNIDSEATTAIGLQVSVTAMTTGNAIDVPDANALTTGSILNLVSDSADTGIRSLVFIKNDNTAATSTTALYLQQDAGANGLYIDHNANGIAVNISHSSATTSSVISCADADGLTTGSILNLISNSSDTGTRSLAFIHNDHTSATNAVCLGLTQDADEGIVNFAGLTGANATSAISSLNTSGATTDHIQIQINGTKAWIAVSTTDPT